MDTSNILILGIGNILWVDEGFGVRVVQELDKTYQFPHTVSILDGGTQGLGLIPYVQEADILIIIDAVDFQLEPGTLILLSDDEVPAYFGAKKMSLHQISFQEVLALCQLLGKSPRQSYLIGVQPEILEDYGGSLSPVVKTRIPKAIDAIRGILVNLGMVVFAKESNQTLLKRAVDMDEYERLRPSLEEAYRFGDSRFLGFGELN